jgi:hypothetical protein
MSPLRDARPSPPAPAPRGGHTAGMNDREAPVSLPGPSLRAALRRALLFGLGGALGAAAVWLATRPPQRTNDNYYAYHRSIWRAEKLALTCYYKKPDRLSDLNRAGYGDDDLQGAWGQPFRYARVPDAAAGEDIYVWTDWTQDGRAFVVGAKVTAGGQRVKLGLPPAD